jgi:hypothetical protein
MALALLGLAGLSQLGATCGPGGNNPPDPDDCGDPRGDPVIATVELGPPGEGDFVPWQNGNQISITYGGQGFAMYLFRVRVTGTGLADCMLQTTHITGDPGLSDIATNVTPLQWYDDPGGGRATRTAFVILDREPQLAEAIHIETTVLGVTGTIDLLMQ